MSARVCPGEAGQASSEGCLPTCSRRDGHIGGSVDSTGIEDAPGYGLVSRSHQNKAVGPCMGTRVRRSEGIVRGRTAAGSELVKCMALLIIVSRLPLAVTVTVRVIGVPAVAAEGAVKSRVACVVPQPNAIDTAIAVVNAHSRRADRAFLVLKLRASTRNLISKRSDFESELCTLFELQSGPEGPARRWWQFQWERSRCGVYSEM